MRFALIMLLALGMAAPAVAADVRTLSFFAGRHTDNVAEEVLFYPREVEWRDAGLAGVALGFERRAPGAHFSVGAELQAVAQFGEQDHLEFNLPLFARWHAPWQTPLRGFSFGLGLSYATEVPETEALRRGDSQRVLFYWMLEAEFGRAGAARTGFARLHHRSDGFGIFETDTGSNALVLGLRRRW